MKILAHRGLWNQVSEKNTVNAIKQAYCNGFGIETDLRDYKEQLVISHDIATAGSPLAETIFTEYVAADSTEFMALNVKADGIQNHIKRLIEQYHIKEYAVFDMSIPEMVVYEKMNINFFTRQSEIESVPVMYDKACGVWMDEWSEDWIRKDIVENHLINGKYVGIISPEIHGRDKMKLWNELKQIKNDKLMLCTDIPFEAGRFFNE